MTSELLNINFTLDGTSYSRDSLVSYFKNNELYYEFLNSWFNSDDFITVNTSGSTGSPKPIHLKKADLISSAKLTSKFFKLPQGSKVINCLPLDYIAGKMMLIRSMVLGWDLNLFPVSSEPIKDISSVYDFIALTPMQLEKSLDYIKYIKKVIVGGSPVSNRLQKKILNSESIIYETYGMTETITHVAVKNISIGEKEFTALPGVEIGQIDSCLFISPNHLSIDRIQTNDLVELTAKNKFILFGRRDFIINSGGIKINPESVEKKLAKYISSDFVISSIDNVEFGEIVVLVFKKNIPIGYQSSFKCLEKYEIPKDVLAIDNFPETNGKFNRLKIRNLINHN